MLPKIHILVGAITTIIIFILFPSISLLGLLLLFLSSFLIDFDHYLYYAIIKKDISLSRAYKWFMNKRSIANKMKPIQLAQYKKEIFLFHGIEFWIVLLLLILVNKIFLFILLGIIIHMTLDFIELYSRNYPLYQKTSQLYNYKKNQGLKSFF